MSGQQTHLAVLADCERALGRPERAIDMYRAADRDQLAPDEAVELLIVAAGARADLGQHEAAVTMLQVRELTADEPWVARLRYAYADALLTVGRRDEAREWFARAAEVDEDAATDAAERLLDLDGVVLDDHDEAYGVTVDEDGYEREGAYEEGEYEEDEGEEDEAKKTRAKKTRAKTSRTTTRKPATSSVSSQWTIARRSRTSTPYGSLSATTTRTKPGSSTTSRTRTTGRTTSTTRRTTGTATSPRL
jgi:tetratricopeptide (TPR) repeat protein